MRDLPKSLFASQSFYLAPHFPSKEAYNVLVENEKKEKAKREENGQRLIDHAKAAGVECQLVCEDGGTVVEESIIDYAKKNQFDLIAMATQSSPFEGAMFGSVTKEVIRRSECPVWATNETTEDNQ